MICFTAKFILTVGIYIAIKFFAGLAAAELYMLVIYALALHGLEKCINDKLKLELSKETTADGTKDTAEKDEDEGSTEEQP